MSDNFKIKTISSFAEYSFKEKASEFIGLAYPIERVEEFDMILHDVKKKYYDARHHCYAFQLFDGTFRYSDDGEPNGTAGIRIYNAIKHFELTNVLVISVRYFGGIKLGVGPLGKAYYNSAYGTIENADIIEKDILSKIRIKYDFDQTKSVHHFINNYYIKILDNLFEDKPVMELLIRPDQIDALKDNLIEASSGKIELSVLEENIVS